MRVERGKQAIFLGQKPSGYFLLWYNMGGCDIEKGVVARPGALSLLLHSHVVSVTSSVTDRVLAVILLLKATSHFVIGFSCPLQYHTMHIKRRKHNKREVRRGGREGGRGANVAI
jgi:hypothetical protein